MALIVPILVIVYIIAGALARIYSVFFTAQSAAPESYWKASEGFGDHASPY